jgi:hypothetical protein
MHVQVRLTDAHDGPFVSATALNADGQIIAHQQAPSKQEALELLEIRLLYVLEKPVTFHIDDWCEDVPHVRVIVEDIAYCGVFVATAYDSDSVELAKGECCCCEGAIDKCLLETSQALHSRRLTVDIDVLDPNDD